LWRCLPEKRTTRPIAPRSAIDLASIRHIPGKRENARVRPGRNCFFEEAFVRDQINTTEDVLSFFNLGRGLKKCKCSRRFQGTPDIDRVGAVFRGLEVKNLRKRRIGAPVEKYSDYAIFIVVN
jgi:hypothetical protein